MKKKALIIFARTPELGKVKTRLAASLGNHGALGVYIFLLKHTIREAALSDADVFLYISGGVEGWSAISIPEGFQVKAQQGEDLGERMNQAFTEIFGLGYQQVIVIGSDCYELYSSNLHDAFEQVEAGKAVIGPARDGGYYLLGLPCMLETIFFNKEWSTPSLLPATLRDLQKEELPVFILETLSDIDTVEDLRQSGLERLL